MEALLVSVVIALITACSGYLALKNKEDVKQITLVTGVLSSHSDRQDKRITELESRERVYLERIAVIEKSIDDCEHEKDILRTALEESRKRL